MLKLPIFRRSGRLPVIPAAFFFAALAGISGYSSAGAAETGDAYVDASIADARTLIPILASDSASSGVCGLLYNGLVKYDKDLKIVGDLAESWDVSPDGMMITFHLRRNVRWHDGAPFTARDVEFTYRKLIDPGVRTPYSGDFAMVGSFVVVDDYTIRLTYKEPFVPGLSSWGMGIMPRHLLENEAFHTTAYARAPVGTGPYAFKSWSTQQKIELKAFPDYFEHRPNIGRVIYRVIPDPATIFLELQTAGIDSAGISPLQYTRQTDTPFFRANYVKYRLPSFGYTYLGYNLRNPLFSDVRVRHALNFAVDKDEIVKVVLLGLGSVCTGPFIPGSWSYNDTVQPVPFSPGRARALLAEAGWTDSDGDGVIDKGGKRFEFTIITNQGNEERMKVAQIIQRRLGDVGISVKIKILEWSVLLAEYIDRRAFEAVILGWSLPREPDNFDIWHSSKTKEGEFNFIGFANAEIDGLLVAGRREFGQEQRRKIYNRIHEVLYEEQPYMFLYVPDSLSMLHKRFRGVAQAPAGIGYNFIEWWVPKQEQRYSTISEK